jgi:hypothetical protein
LLDAGTIDLALGWRAGANNPIVDAVVAVLDSMFAADALTSGGQP